MSLYAQMKWLYYTTVYAWNRILITPQSCLHNTIFKMLALCQVVLLLMLAIALLLVTS